MAIRVNGFGALTLAVAVGGASLTVAVTQDPPPMPPVPAPGTEAPASPAPMPAATGGVPSPPAPGEAIPLEAVGGQAVPVSGTVAPDGTVVGLPPFPAPCGCVVEDGFLKRSADCIHRHLHEHWIGHPRFFAEPRFGASLYETMGRQKAKADLHTFTLYRSDFLAGTTKLSPGGARRLSFLASRLGRWHGPIVVEWTPDEPEIALGRRDTIVAALQQASLAVAFDRVVVGPSAFHGIMGPDAGNNHDALIFRDFSAPRAFSFTPTSTAEFGGGAR